MYAVLLFLFNLVLDPESSDLYSLRVPMLNINFGKNMHLWMSSRGKYVGCAHERFVKSSVPMPNNFVIVLIAIDSCFELLVPKSMVISGSLNVEMKSQCKMKFCNQWQSHISTVWVQTLSSNMTSSPPTDRSLSEAASRI